MENRLDNNPFSALFPSVQQCEEYTLNQSTESTGGAQQVKEPEKNKQSSITPHLEDLLLVTTNEEGPSGNNPCLLLKDLPELTLENSNFILFERLLCNVQDAQIVFPKAPHKSRRNDNDITNQVKQTKVIRYIVETYERCWQRRNSDLSDAIKILLSQLIRNLITSLQQPELYPEQNPITQFQQLLVEDLSSSPHVQDLLFKYIETVLQEEKNLPSFFESMTKILTSSIRKSSLMTLDYSNVDIIELFASSTHLAPLLLDVGLVAPINGASYEETALGSLIAISCLPKKRSLPYEFFDTPSRQSSQTHDATTDSISQTQNNLYKRIQNIFLKLLKLNKEMKDKFLKWIEGLIVANSGRGGSWHIQSGGLEAMMYASDGFMINLGGIMLLLACPFTRDVCSNAHPSSFKIMQVDPTYCVAKKEAQGVYSGDLGKQTMFVPRPENADLEIDLPDYYSFTTTWFYLTHRAVHLGLQVVYQKLKKLAQDLSRLHHQHTRTSESGAPGLDMLQNHIERMTQMLLSLKAASLNNQLVENLLEFLTASSHWLIQAALTPPDTKPFVLKYKEIKLPLPENEIHKFLYCIPEFIIENFVESIRTMKRFSTDSVFSMTEHFMNTIMSFIVVFMGSSDRIYNPHVRAHLAECLESMISDKSNISTLMYDGHGSIFSNHPLKSHLVTALIEVFVSIEMTGQSVQFEEKFNYRRPMYIVMKYLWDLPEHRQNFVILADEALANMEAAKPPLFLKFINLLINDAIFLLDEGLQYMSKIKDLLAEKDSGEWDNLPEHQKQEKERNLAHVTLLAEFNNMMGTSTVEIIIMLSDQIPRIFVHKTLVDRIASMLNYFLLHLVGPKQKSLKVRDMEKYKFRPSEIVTNICRIYCNLGTNPAFAVAVCSDGRSYSPQLFQQACNVLTRIFQNNLCEEMEKLGEKVQEAGLKQKEDEDLAASAPDEFLDPIMSNLMVDPVILPSSQVTCDRSTIARHLLSDQSDPFNRSPLTMEEILPNNELKERIDRWLEEQRNSRNN